ncbi:MAG TPA: C40 family peptidase, partial [Gemmatimonadales bacterium]|nr:C40 family peptidase [Gemmatimonadales bacterium]
MMLFAGVLSAATVPERALAQNAEARVGRFYDSTGWMAYRFGVTRPLGGIFRHQLHADLLRRTGGVGNVAGIGIDVTAFRRGEEGGYLVAGLSGGLGSDRANDFSELWGSWSAGAGYDLFPVSFMSVGAEARWRRLSLGHREGLEVAIGLAVHGKRRWRRPDTPRAEIPSDGSRLPEMSRDPADSLRAAPRMLQDVNDSIVATATEAMGRPYTYGGTGEDGEGFDCSGLIQYAYGKHGIGLPRRSTDQAREGRKIDRRLKLLSPADILTFSNHGGKVSHVGLYIGDGRFIHSATRGVQVSVLSPDDPYGRWWYKRWVGVRRIVK